MKNIKKILFLLIFAFSFCIAGDETNKTFFLPRSQSVNLAMQMPRWLSFIYQDPKDHFGSSFQLTSFYQESTNGTDLCRYFMFDKKSTLQIGGANQDVHPWNFNLGTNYEGTITFHPEQNVLGERLDFYQNLYKLCKGLYYSISTAIVKVENNPGFAENITNAGAWWNTTKKVFAGGRLSSDWSERWRYGKIEGKKHKTGLADIDAKLGYKILDQNKFKFSANLVLTIPTGNKAKAVYFFEPIVGNNRHWAFGGGLDSIFKIWRNDNGKKSFSLIICADYRYLFENKQIRTLELKNKKWGRYIRMRQQDPNAAANVLGNTIPGINVMTRGVKVEPGNQLDFLASLQFKCNDWHFELGYNLWAKESEDISLNSPWTEPGIFGLNATDNPFAQNVAIQAGIPNFAAAQLFFQLIYPQTAATGISSATTINTFAAGNGIFIQESDVDLSGHPSALSHKIFGNASLDFTFKKQPMLVGLGASYEFADDNTELEQWALWLKLAITL